MDRFFYFAETTLWWIVALFFLAGIGMRSLFCLSQLFWRSSGLKRQWGPVSRLTALIRLFVPLHKALATRPVHAGLRYVFHVCLFIVPIWFSGHIYLWEESRFMWYWTPLPDGWADGMTLLVIAMCLFFGMRRLFIKAVRRVSSPFDGLIVLIAGLPFLSGYCLTHGTLNRIAFFESHLLSLHVLSGEIMLAAVVFLFVRTRLIAERCVGCVACVENCPTQTLAFSDRDAVRTIRYSHYQCICCGTCVAVCPEQAADLRHELSVLHFLRICSKQTIRSLELARCAHCGLRFAPQAQIAKLADCLKGNQVDMTRLNCCNRCKKLAGGSVDRQGSGVSPAAGGAAGSIKPEKRFGAAT